MEYIRLLILDHTICRFYQKTQIVCPILDQAFTRYYNIIFFGTPEISEEKKMMKLREMKQHGRFWKSSPPGKNLVELMGLSVSITECNEMYPSLGSNESCESLQRFQMGALHNWTVSGYMLQMGADLWDLVIESTICDFFHAMKVFKCVARTKDYVPL